MAVGVLVLARGSGVNGALQYLVLAFLGQGAPQEPWHFQKSAGAASKHHVHWSYQISFSSCCLNPVILSERAMRDLLSMAPVCERTNLLI